LSYAADEFFEQTAAWYDAICPILAKHAYPNGGVVAAQVDNEMAYFFNVNAYACDYSQASLARYRQFVCAKYGGLDGINAIYGANLTDLTELDPPRRFDAKSTTDIPYYADWAEYRERYLIDAIGRLAQMLRQRGLDKIALFHNYPHPLGPGGAASGFTSPFNITGLEEAVDFVGFDVYSRKELYHHVKTVISYVVGTSRYPYIPEFIAGVWAWYLNPGDLHDEEFVTKAALMHGVRGFSRYMLVERNKWLDSPIRRDGSERPDKVDMFSKVNQTLTNLNWASLQRQAPVLLLANREYDRLEAAAVLVSFPGDFLETPSGFSEYPNALTVSEDTLGFDQPVQMAKNDWFAGFEAALAESGVGYLLSDTDLTSERLAEHKVVVLPTFDYLDQSIQRKLVGYVQAGGTLVIGPKAPTMDSQMRPCTILADAAAPGGVGQDRIIVVAKLSDMAQMMAAVLTQTELVGVALNDSRLDATIHLDQSNPSRLVAFLANPTDQPIEARLELGRVITSVTEVWEGQAVPTDGQAISQMLPAHTIRIYQCQVTA
jgi:beta-galactosidase